MRINWLQKKIEGMGRNDTRNANFHVALGDDARSRQEWNAAAKHYFAALELDPQLPDIWVQYGHALKEDGDLAQAHGAYARSIEISPVSADTHLHLGHVLKMQGMSDLAGEAYLESFKLDPIHPSARSELINLGWKREDLSAYLAENGAQPEAQAEETLSIAIDVSDLMHYFLHARVPTGIQRVQLNVASSLLAQRPADVAISLACFSEGGNFWVEIAPALFTKVARLATSGGDVAAPEWQAVLGDLRGSIANGLEARFATGAVLLNLGTSWWLQNYFLMVRRAKARFGIRYVPFVHDMIPVLTPEHCVEGLRRDFVSWLSGVFDHADGYLANSQATRRDLLDVAGRLGRSIAVEEPVRLDAAAETMRKNAPRHGPGGAWTARMGVGERPFVLFVSTIESRKNHLLAFETWLAMIRERGLDKTPDLACVGNKGWMVEAAMARLSSSEELQARVHLLSQVADGDLRQLYDNCLFTIYPSAYEGWGLPVTESLCHGKVPLISRVSSLPEAGGDHADYFDVESRRDFREKLERLIDDSAYRAARERAIAEGFRPRRWADVAGDIVTALREVQARLLPTDSQSAAGFEAEPGRYYPLARDQRGRLSSADSTGERFREGAGWAPPDRSGSPLTGPAELVFQPPSAYARPGAEYHVMFQVAAQNADVSFVLNAEGNDRRARAGEASWVRAWAKADGDAGGTIRIAIAPRPRKPEVETADARLLVCGFCFLRADDREGRLDLMERIALGEIERPDLAPPEKARKRKSTNGKAGKTK